MIEKNQRQKYIMQFLTSIIHLKSDDCNQKKIPKYIMQSLTSITTHGVITKLIDDITFQSIEKLCITYHTKFHSNLYFSLPFI